MIDGEKIRRLRYGLGMTQNELAEKSETTQAAISAIEMNARSPHPGTLKKLAEVLGVETRELLKKPEEAT